MKDYKVLFKKIKETVLSNKIFTFTCLLVLLLGVISIPRIFAQLQPIKSIEVFSEKLDYEKKEPGAWKIDKSARWISKGTAEITFDVDTVMKSNVKYTDILLVLDVSGSMDGEKLDRVKNDASELINSLLSNDKNRAGLITFESASEIVSGLTNNKDELIEKVNALSNYGGTNYYQALVNVDFILKDYVKEKDRECIVLFLTDGYPNEQTPNEEGQYSYLKNQYPFITINGVQYEMGSSILEPIKKVSDAQYMADMDTLNNVLFEASVSPIAYDNFEITDYIDKDYFYVESDNDVKVSQGSVTFDKENQRFTWKMDSLKSGLKAKMTIKAKLKDELIGEGGLYPTNEKEEIKSKIDEDNEYVESLKTPILADNYKVIYDDNKPDSCRVEGIPGEKQHSVFDTVAISDSVPKCDGYQFKGWDVTTKDVNKINDDYFIMPGDDVTLKAIWSKLDIKKSMEGTVKENLTLYKQVKQDAETNNHAKKYTGETNTFNGTEDIYYYYGETPNNNVIFGGFCWRMYRTTDTGGVKMVYNGEPDVEGKCGTSRGNHVGYGSRTWYNLSSNYMYGTDYTYDEASKIFTLSGNLEQATWNDTTSASLIGKYTCQTTTGSCGTLYYVESYNSSSSAYVLPLNSTTNYSFIGSSAFNENRYSLADVGYMYNKIYTYKEKDMSSSSFDSITETIELIKYNVISNDASDEYTFDDETKKWTSNNHTDNSSSTIEFSVVEDGTYYFEYAVSSENGYDKATVYVDGVKKGEYSGTVNSTIELENLTTSNIIKVVYSKDTSVSMGTDNIIFNLRRITGTVDNRWLFGNSFTYENGIYTLKDYQEADFINDYSSLSSKHYTCFNKEGTCEKIGYIYYKYGNNAHYIELENGTSVEKALDEMLYDNNVNTTNSTIKTVIDAWYSRNMTQYTDYFEDTVWCNDRSMKNQSSNGWNPNGGSNSTMLYFRSYGNSSSLMCPNKNDRFTVEAVNGNGALTYPVGLVTEPELALAYTSNSPLSSGGSNWSLSPYYFSSNVSGSFLNNSYGDSLVNLVRITYGVRPAVSLRAGIEYSEGDGSVDTPYIIDMDS